MAPGVGKVVTISGNDLLNQLSDDEFLEEYFVVALDLSAVRDRMGPRWERRKEQVWEHLSRSVERRLVGEESFQRITETGFAVALMRPSRAAAVAVGAHALQDTLHFFLGEALLTDIRMSQVKSLDGAELTCAAIDPKDIQKAAASWTLGGEAERPDGVIRQSPVLTLRTASGRLLEVMIAIQRINMLAAHRPSALRAEPFITDPKTKRRLKNSDRQQLDFGDVAAIDAAVMGLARGFWEKEPELGPIIVPVSFHTVSRTGARTKLLEQAGILADESRIYMLCEIIDAAPGTPSGRIAEAVALTQTFSRGVFLECLDPTWLKNTLSGARVLGLTFNGADWREEQAPILTKKLFAFAEAGRTMVRALIAHSLPSPALVEICAAAGLTHAAGRAQPSSPMVRINDDADA